MADVNIDSLLIDVQANTTGAQKSLEELENTLSKLKTGISGGIGLTSVINQLGKLEKASKDLSSSSAQKLKGFAAGLQEIGKVGNVKLSSSIANQLTEIGTAVDVLDGVNFYNLNKLASGITSLSGVSNVKISSSLGNQITNIGAAADNLKGIDFSNLTNLATGLNSLGAAGNVKISSSIANQLTSIGTAAQSLQGVDFTSLTELGDALRTLEDLPKINITSFVNGLKKLDEIDLSQLNNQIQQLTTIMQPLATEMTQVAAGFAAFPTRIQNLIKQNEKLADSTTKVNSKLSKFLSLVNFAGVMSITKRVGSTIAGWINSANEYVEDVNLFSVSLGKYAEEASAYAKTVSNALGISYKEYIRNEGVFMNLATGFGVASDRAYTMSKNLTNLAYDMSSLMNMPIETAMQKLQSGFAGELEPLRRVGYDLSKQALMEIANELNITKKYSDMTQAEKSQLRYYAIMTQVTSVQGDMTRTLESSANQIRILKSQLTMLTESLGSIFIPLLNKVLPILISIVKVMRLIASTIANIFGFKLPDVDYEAAANGVSSITEEVEDTSDALSDATKKASEYKNAVMGFDEINLLPDPTKGSSKSSSSGSSGDDSQFDFELPEYTFMDAINTKVDTLYEKLKSVLGLTEDLDSNWQSLKITINDTFFQWEDLTPEQIAEKISTGVMGLFGGITGFMLGGPVGALVGTLTGVGLSTIFNSLLFDHDGEISLTELKELLKPAINGLIGGVLGLAVGGPGGALFGFTVGAGITIGLESLLLTGNKKFKGVATRLALLLTAAVGGAIGFKYGGVGGALIGATLSLGLSYVLAAFEPDSEKSKVFQNDILQSVVKGLNMGLGAVKGYELGAKFAVGGPGGAAIGLVVGLGVSFFLEYFNLDEEEQKKYAGPFDFWRSKVGIPTNNEITSGMESLMGSAKTGMENGVGDLYSSAKSLISDPILEATGNISTDTFMSTQLATNGKAIGVTVGENVETGLDDGLKESLSKENEGSSIWDKIKYYVFTPFSEWVGKDNVTSDVEQVGSDIGKGFNNGLEENLNENTLKSHITLPIMNEYDNLIKVTKIGSPSKLFYDVGKNIVQGLINGFEEKWNEFSRSTEQWFNQFKSWWESRVVNGWTIKLPHIKISYSAASASMRKLYGIASIPQMSVSWYAKGGFPAAGDLFFANERGPELVGSMNGKTTVANQEEIIEGIKRGVLEAMMIAEKDKPSTGNTAVFNVNGKQFCRAIYSDLKSVSNEHGISLVNA